jgi:transient receptor potential cation channel subfamily C protein 4
VAWRIIICFPQVRSRERAMERHETVARLLVRRFVTAEQRKRDDFGISEDDVMEIRQDISTLRFELIDIFRDNGMKAPQVDSAETASNLKIIKIINKIYRIICSTLYFRAFFVLYFF